jgi:vacuolar-type H+-ATPase subunit E/Vma4
MPIQEIEKRILEEAQAKALKINQEADKKIKQIEEAGLRKIEETKAKILDEARNQAEEVKRYHLVPARLKARKEILEEKQKYLSDLYNEIQREKKLSAADINRIRDESEVKASMILFAK